MTIARDSHTNNIVIGAGEVYFDEEDAAGNLTGERYLGDSIAATIGATSERTTILSGDGAVAERLVDAVRSIDRTIGFTLHDMSLENWDLFIFGAGVSDSAAVQAARVAGANAWAIAAPRADRWYQIGATPENPAGVGAVKDTTADGKNPGVHDAGADAVIITTEAAAPAAGNTVPRGDYELDWEAGRIRVLKAPAAGTGWYVHYKPEKALAAGARRIARTGTIRQRRGAVRYIETPASGKGRNVYARRVVLGPAGEATLKSRDTEQQLAFTGAISAAPGGLADLLIDGEPA